MSPLVLLLVAPTVVAKTSLRNHLAGWAAPKSVGQVNIGAAELSWFAPVKIHDLAIKDSVGEVAVSVPLIESDCTLWQLATGRYENATVRVDSPKANWTLNSEGSNLEELLQPFLEPTDSKTETTRPIKIEIEGGELTLTQTETGSRSQIRNINCTIDQKRGSALPEIDLMGRWSAVAADDVGSGNGGITASLRTVGDANSEANGTHAGSWHIETHQLAAGFLEPLIQRVYPQARLSGFLNVDVNFDQPVDATGRSFLAYGHVDCRNLAATVPELFFGDRLFFDTIDIDGRIDVEGDTVSFNKFNVDSSIFKLTADGDARLPGHTSVEQTDVAAGRDLEVVAVVDLPSMATMMPETLHLHPDLRVDAGRLLAQIGTKSTTEKRDWIARLKVTQISGRHQGKTIQWEDPVAVEVSATQTSHAITIEQLRCDSSFMNVTGSGDVNHAKFDGSCNLNILMQNISQFVETNDHRIAGQMTFDARWNRVANHQSTIAANARVNDFILQSPNLLPWREKQLTVSLSGMGNATLNELNQINQLEFSLLSQSDRLAVALIEPTTVSRTKPVPLRMKLSGNLNSWAARTSPFVNLGTWRPSGRVDAVGVVAFSDNQFQINETTVIADDFTVSNGDFVIQDRHVEATIDANYEYGSQHGFANVSIVGRELSASAKSVEFTLGRDQRMAGHVQLDARLGSALKMTNGLQIGGVLSSRAELSNSGSESQFSLLGTVKDLQFIRPVGGQTRIAGTQTVLNPEQWLEPEVRFAAQGKLTDEVLQLDGISLKTRGMGVTGHGNTLPSSSGLQSDFSGELGYDLAAVSKALEVILGMDIRATGTGRQPFQLRGPLLASNSRAGSVSPDLEASFGIDWKTVSMDQVSVGEGQLQARLQNQVLRFAPTSMVINNAGRLNIRPVLSFDAGQPVLHLNQETSIDNAVLTRELTSQWIGYVAPLLANTAEVDGRFSARLSKATIPLWNTSAADVGGELQIERADARPGPTAIKLIQLVRQVRSILGSKASESSISEKTLIRMGQQTAQFRLVEGRIHHRGLNFEVDGVPIQTSGSVGLDQSMLITAEIPIRKSWVEKDKTLSRLAGQKLSIPISGTASNPRVDNRIIADLARQIGQSATQGLIEDKVNDTLNDLGKKLFGN